MSHSGMSGVGAQTRFSCSVEREMSSTDEVRVPGVVNSLFLTLGSLFTKLGQGDLAFIKSVAGRLERIHKPDSLLEAPIRLSHKIGGNAVPWGAYDADGVFHYVFENGQFTTIRRMSAYADGFEDITPSSLSIASIDKFERTFRGDIAYVAEDRIKSNTYQHVIVWGDIVCELPLSFDDAIDQIAFGQTETHWQIAFSYQPEFTSPARYAMIWSYPKDPDEKKTPEKKTISDIKYIQAIGDQICIVGSESSFRDAFVVWGSITRGFGRKVSIFEESMIVHDGCLQFIIEEDDGSGYKTYKRVTISPEGTMKAEGFSAGLDPEFYRTEDRIFVVRRQQGRYEFAAVDMLISSMLTQREIWRQVIGKDVTFVSTPDYVCVLHKAPRIGMRMGAPWPVLCRYKNDDSLTPAGSTQVTENEIKLHECAGQVFVSREKAKQRPESIQLVDELFWKPAKDRVPPMEILGSVRDLTAVIWRSDLIGYHFREGTLFLTGYNL